MAKKPSTIKAGPPGIKRWHVVSALGVAATVFAVVSGVYTGYVWLDSKLEEKAEQRIKPYEDYLIGDSYVREEEYDKAVGPLGESFDALSKKDASGRMLVPLVDDYLYAIANSERPLQYSNRLNAINDLIAANRLAPDAFVHYQMGWYYFRTGDLAKARELFNRAETEYRGEERRRVIADDYWALALVELADPRGDLGRAVEQAKKAAAANPRDYDLQDRAKDMRALEADELYKPLLDLYPDLPKNWAAFLGRLKSSGGQG